MRDIVKCFGDLTAVDHVNLQIRDGEIFSLLGPSGCGKSTLLRVVAGLENQDQGDVLIAGQKVNQLPPYKRDCNTVFQNHALFPHMSVYENVAFGLRCKKIPEQEIKQRVMEVLRMVKLDQLASRKPHQLSGGQKQRVMIALTEGNDTGSKIPPEEAAVIAADHEITIHTVAVGDPEAVGEEKMDVAALEAVTQKTGGRFFTANDRVELSEIYTELDRIEERVEETLSHRPRNELFPWPIGALFLMSLLSYTIPLFRKEASV